MLRLQYNLSDNYIRRYKNIYIQSHHDTMIENDTFILNEKGNEKFNTEDQIVNIMVHKH